MRRHHPEVPADVVLIMKGKEIDTDPPEEAREPVSFLLLSLFSMLDRGKLLSDRTGFGFWVTGEHPNEEASFREKIAADVTVSVLITKGKEIDTDPPEEAREPVSFLLLSPFLMLDRGKLHSDRTGFGFWVTGEHPNEEASFREKIAADVTVSVLITKGKEIDTDPPEEAREPVSFLLLSPFLMLDRGKLHSDRTGFGFWVTGEHPNEEVSC